MHLPNNPSLMWALIFAFIIFLTAHHGVESFSPSTSRASLMRGYDTRTLSHLLYSKTDKRKLTDKEKQLDAASSIKWASQTAKALALSTLFSIGSLSPCMESVVQPAAAIETTHSTSLSKQNEFSTSPSSLLISSTDLARIKPSSIAKKGMPRVATIMDLAGVLDPQQDVPRITRVIERAQRQTQSEIQIVIVNQVQEGYTPKRMATTLFNQWRLGPAEKNNGVLILVVLDERRTEIEVGKGLNKAMNADWCQGTLQETASPAFRREEYGEGLLATVERVSKRLEEVDSGAVVYNNRHNSWVEWSEAAFIFSGYFWIYAYDRKYPIKENCPECNADKKTWEVGEWITTLEATDKWDGQRQSKSTCKSCGYVYTRNSIIRKYDGSTVDSNGSVSYYYDSGVSGGDSGGSSDGGGGGDSW